MLVEREERGAQARHYSIVIVPVRRHLSLLPVELAGWRWAASGCGLPTTEAPVSCSRRFLDRVIGPEAEQPQVQAAPEQVRGVEEAL